MEMRQFTIADVATGKPQNVFRTGKSMIYHATFGSYGYGQRDGKEYGYFAGLSLGGSGGGSSVRAFDANNGYIGHGHTDLFEGQSGHWPCRQDR